MTFTKQVCGYLRMNDNNLSSEINPLSPNSDQHQFSPNDIHRLSMRFNKLITKRSIFDLSSNSLN